jgi:hypothetical protein
VSRDTTVTGSYWPPGAKVTITFTQAGLSTQIGSQNVQSNGSFLWKGGVPSTAVPNVAASITVCAGSICVTKPITVTT